MGLIQALAAKPDRLRSMPTNLFKLINIREGDAMTKDRWRSKRCKDGKVIQNTWETEHGYTVSSSRLSMHKFAITRPNGEIPFAYAQDISSTTNLIKVDLAKFSTAEHRA